MVLQKSRKLAVPDITAAAAETEESSSAPSKGWLEDGRNSFPGSSSSLCYNSLYASWLHFWWGGDIRWYMIGGKVIEVVNGKSIVRSEGRGSKKKDTGRSQDASKSCTVDAGTVTIDMNTCNAVGSAQSRYITKLFTLLTFIDFLYLLKCLVFLIESAYILNISKNIFILYKYTYSSMNTFVYFGMCLFSGA